MLNRADNARLRHRLSRLVVWTTGAWLLVTLCHALGRSYGEMTAAPVDLTQALTARHGWPMPWWWWAWAAAQIPGGLGAVAWVFFLEVQADGRAIVDAYRDRIRRDVAPYLRSLREEGKMREAGEVEAAFERYLDGFDARALCDPGREAAARAELEVVFCRLGLPFYAGEPKEDASRETAAC